MGESINPKEFKKELAQENGFDPHPYYPGIKSTVIKDRVIDPGWKHHIPKSAPPAVKNYLEKMLGMGVDVDAGRLSGNMTCMTGDVTSRWYKPNWRSTPYDPDKYHGINPTDMLTPTYTAYMMWDENDNSTDELDYIDIDWTPWLSPNDINRQAQMRMDAHVAGTPNEWYPMCESMVVFDGDNGPAVFRYYQPLPWFCQWYVNDGDAEDSDLNKYPNEDGVYAISWKREPSGKRWIHSYKIPEYPTEDGTYELVVSGGKPSWRKKT